MLAGFSSNTTVKCIKGHGDMLSTFVSRLHTQVVCDMVMVKRKRSSSVSTGYGRTSRYRQAGYGVPNFNVFRAQQRGHGLGGMFRGLFRQAVPFLKKGLASAGKRALKAGGNILEDVLINKTPLKSAVKKRAKTEFNDIKNKIVSKPINRGARVSQSITTPARPRKRGRKKNPPGGFRKITL